MLDVKPRKQAAGQILLLSALTGVVSGAVLELLTVLLAAYGPSGPGWSLRGNGALVVPLGLGPSVLAGDWTARVLRSHARPHWLRTSAVVVAIGILLVLLELPVISVTRGELQQALGLATTLPVFALPFVAPAIAWLRVRHEPAHAAAWESGGAAIYTILLVAAFAGLEYLIPPG